MINVLGILHVLVSSLSIFFTLLFLGGFWDVYARFNGEYMGALFF